MLGFITDQMFKPRMAFSKLALLPYILSKNKIKVIYKGETEKNHWHNFHYKLKTTAKADTFFRNI